MELLISFSGANLVVLITMLWKLSARLTALETRAQLRDEQILEMREDVKRLLLQRR